MSAFGGKADIGRPFRRIGSPAGGACYLFIMIIIRHETTATACWALLLIVRTLSNDAITIAVWTGFHVCLPVDTPASLTRQPEVMHDTSTAGDESEEGTLRCAWESFPAK